ncbi:hypothetical protein [Streptomyces sp. KS 21]|nr:hypothetical protein [Streptomyces sp. KS 21]
MVTPGPVPGATSMEPRRASFTSTDVTASATVASAVALFCPVSSKEQP